MKRPTVNSLLNLVVKPVPTEPRAFQALRDRIESGEPVPAIELLVLENHDAVWRTKRKLRMSIIENRVLYVFAVALVAITISLVSKVDDLQTQQANGRTTSLGVTCSAIGAIIEGGQAAIGGSILGPGNPDDPAAAALERNLVQLGFPPAKQRQQQARLAADAYANLIQSRVVEATGLSDLVRDNGTINCARLRQVARLPAKK